MIIIMPIEVKVRELLSKVFISYQIKQSFVNCKIILGCQRDIFNNIHSIKDSIYFDKNTFYNKISKNKALDGNYKFMLDEEGPNSLHSNVIKNLRLNNKSINFYDNIFLWGHDDLKISQKKSCQVLGHPKFDLLKKPYNQIFTKEITDIKKKFKKYILITSSFEFDCLDNRLEKRQIKLNSTLNFAIEKFETERKKRFENYKSQILLTKNLALRFKNINIIYRPHPSQVVELVKKRFKSFGRLPKNLHIIFRGSVTPWISGCDVYIHSGCNTHFEAFVFKKNIINFFKTKIINYKKYSYIGETFFKEKECIDHVENLLKKKNKLKVNKRIYNIILNLKNNVTFHKNFIMFLKNYKNISSKITFGENKKNIKDLFFSLLSIIKNKIILKTFLFHFLPEQILYSKEYKIKKFNFLKKKEISNLMNKFYKLDKQRRYKPQITFVSKNVYMIN